MYQEGTWTEKDNYYFTGTFNNGDPYTGTWYNPDGTVYMKIKNGNTEIKNGNKKIKNDNKEN